jgi:YD repeat-containing protein
MVQYRSAAVDLPLATLVTVSRPQDGNVTWTYTDALDRKIATRRRGFDGRFTETAIGYNQIGKPASEAKPHFILEPVLEAATTYDDLLRLKTAKQDLGQIGGSGSSAATTSLTTTYAGLTNYLDEIVGGKTRRRSETKNALGKIATVTDRVYQVDPGDADAHDVTIRYEYDPDGNVLFVRDPAGNVVESHYDPRGRKTTTVDPDLGAWTYEYNGYGDLISQTDAQGQKTTMTYDTLGRMTSKTELAGTPQAGTSEWVYDAEPGGIGKLVAMVSAPDPGLAAPCSIPHTTVSGGNRAGRSFKYTEFGELGETTECTDGATFVTTYTYDSLGRQSSIQYPAVNGKRLAVGYHYTSLGYLHYTLHHGRLRGLRRAVAGDQHERFRPGRRRKDAKRGRNDRVQEPGARLVDDDVQQGPPRWRQAHSKLRLHIRRGRQPDFPEPFGRGERRSFDRDVHVRFSEPRADLPSEHPTAALRRLRVVRV